MNTKKDREGGMEMALPTTVRAETEQSQCKEIPMRSPTCVRGRDLRLLGYGLLCVRCLSRQLDRKRGSHPRHPERGRGIPSGGLSCPSPLPPPELRQVARFKKEPREKACTEQTAGPSETGREL